VLTVDFPIADPVAGLFAAVKTGQPRERHRVVGGVQDVETKWSIWWLLYKKKKIIMLTLSLPAAHI
jgi:hypothetical protein